MIAGDEEILGLRSRSSHPLHSSIVVLLVSTVSENDTVHSYPRTFRDTFVATTCEIVHV